MSPDGIALPDVSAGPQSRAPEPAPPTDRSRVDLAIRFALRYALVLGLAAMIVTFSLADASFLTVGNLRNIALASAITAIVAVPSAFLILSGYIDLSVGSNLALGAMTAGILMTHDVAPVLACLAAIGAATLIGVLNGGLICWLGLSSIVVTLGTLTFVRGLALGIDSSTIAGFPESFTSIGTMDVLGVPVLVIVAAATFVLGWLVLERTAVGRHVHAIGVNPEAAFLSGVKVRTVPFWLYVVTGTAVGVAAVLYLARIASVTPAISGNFLELEVLTAVLLGGVAFGGGAGSIGGVLLGVAFLGVLQNGLTLLNAPTAVASMTKGLALVFAAGLYAASRRVADD